MKICIQICSGLEWRAVKKIFAVKAAAVKTHSLGEYFEPGLCNRVAGFDGGWRDISV